MFERQYEEFKAVNDIVLRSKKVKLSDMSAQMEAENLRQ
mgnify:CR=1 FL=1